MPRDFLKLHEMIIGATAPGGVGDDSIVEVGAAIADEMQRAYTMSVCAFDGTADYARRLSTLDESSALKWSLLFLPSFSPCFSPSYCHVHTAIQSKGQ